MFCCPCAFAVADRRAPSKLSRDEQVLQGWAPPVAQLLRAAEGLARPFTEKLLE